MASLAAKLASAAETQPSESSSKGNGQIEGSQQPDKGSKPWTLRRNTQFSSGSHLVVLRDGEGSRDASNLHRPSMKTTESGQEYIPRSYLQQRNETTESDLLQKRPRHMAFHDGIQRELEARSALYARQNSNFTPHPVLLDNDPSPPPFFKENFPFPLRSTHEASEHRENNHLSIDSLTSVRDKADPSASGTTTNLAVSPSIDSSSSQSSTHASIKSASPEFNILSPTPSLRSLAPGPHSLDSIDPIHVSTLQSSNELECFATDARIRGWQRVGSYARGWVAYDVLVEAKSVSVVLTQGILLQSYKRYSSFLDLARRLRTEVPQYAKELPSLPPRHGRIWHKYLPDFLEGRRRALQQWLHYTIQDPRWGTTRTYREWVLER